MKLVILDFLDKQKEYEERLSKLDEVLSRVDSLEGSLKYEIRKRKSAERKVADLRYRNELKEVESSPNRTAIIFMSKDC